MKGKVTWFRPSLGYGFITSDDGKDYFVHIRDLRISGHNRLVKNESVEFDIIKDDGKDRAINIKKFDISTDKEPDFFDFIRQCLTEREVVLSAEKGKGDVQIEQAIGFLLTETSPYKLVDYGCGRGRLLEGLRTLDDTSKKQISYVGVDLEYPYEAETFSKSTGISSEFYTVGDFENISIKAKYIFLINVLHEIPYCQLPKRLYNIFRSLESGGWILIHDMLQLDEGEIILRAY